MHLDIDQNRLLNELRAFVQLTVQFSTQGGWSNFSNCTVNLFIYQAHRNSRNAISGIFFFSILYLRFYLKRFHRHFLVDS